MSRCFCDRVMSDSEMTAKRVMPDGSETYWDCCTRCRREIQCAVDDVEHVPQADDWTADDHDPDVTALVGEAGYEE